MIFLPNCTGGYFIGESPKRSIYDGAFFESRETLWKALSSVQCVKENTIVSQHQYWNTALQKRKNGMQEVFSWRAEGLQYTKTSRDEVYIFLDMRTSYDREKYERTYTVTKTPEGIRVRFSKKRSQEHDLHEYELNMWIAIDEEYTLVQKWEPCEYARDVSRGEAGCGYVFCLLKTRAKNIVFSDTAPSVSSSALFAPLSFTEKPVSAREYAEQGICSLVSHMHGRSGILAGYPWFFQYWVRDEAISAWGLFLSGKQEEAKAILMHAIGQIQEDGRIPNRIPEADIGCADGVGWVFFRLRQIYDMGSISVAEASQILSALRRSLGGLRKYHLQKEGITNASQETWMDTVYANDTRSGVRIEIQALTLQMYDFLVLLSGDTKIQSERNAFKKTLLSFFWNGKYLRDGVGDDTVRPNVFLAAYITPDLLSADQWEKCFDSILPKLWCCWGGLSTIDSHDALFCNQHTGSNNQSYHRGDSWFFVNNISAIVLSRRNRQKYASYIQAIYSASERDILEMGAVGGASEVSSAETQTFDGCFAQAWSTATFVELCEEFGKR